MREWIRINCELPWNELGNLPTLLVLAEDSGNIYTSLPYCFHESEDTGGGIGPRLTYCRPHAHDRAAGIASGQ